MTQSFELPPPSPASLEHTRNIVTDIIFALVTCGLFSLYIEYKQIQSLNEFLKRPAYSFGMWLLLAIITCGLYNIYHSYKKSEDVQKLLMRQNSEPVLIAIIQFFGLWIVVHSIQQVQINEFAAGISNAHHTPQV